MGLAELLTTILILALFGFIVYLIVTYIPMPPIFKTVLMVVVAVLVIIWLIGILGGAGHPVLRL